MSFKPLAPMLALAGVPRSARIVPTAQAGGHGAILYGDHNSDGVVDPAALGLDDLSRAAGC